VLSRSPGKTDRKKSSAEGKERQMESTGDNVQRERERESEVGQQTMVTREVEKGDR